MMKYIIQLNFCILSVVTLFSYKTLKGFNGVKKTLIESSILIGTQNFPINNSIGIESFPQRRLNQENKTSLESEIAKVSPDLIVHPDLVNSLSLTFKSFPSDELEEATSYAINYLYDHHDSIGIYGENLLGAIKSILVSFIEVAYSQGENIKIIYPQLVGEIYQSLIPEKISSKKYSIPSWSKDLSKIFIEATFSDSIEDINSELHQSICKEITLANLTILNNSSFTSNDFIPKISQVEPSRKLQNEDMKFDGVSRFMKFDPIKTAFLQFSSRGLAEGIFDDSNNDLNTQVLGVKTKMIGETISSSVIEFLSSLDGDNSLFAYESINAISTGIALGSVYRVSKKELYLESDLPFFVAESISNSISSQSISTSLTLGNGFELHRLAESVAFGTSMGAQLATVLDKSLDYEENWELYSRSRLAEATSKGSANGSLNAASQYIQNDPSVPDTTKTTTRKEILQVASGSALGSLMGTTGLAIYYPTTMEIIKSASQGVSSGGMTAQNLSMIDKPKGITEEFEVEIARALAFGASEGALFQIVALQNKSNPNNPDFEDQTIKTAESVSFGSAFGAVTGGIQSGEDPLIIKQAINQGITEGSSVGISLALGYDETVANKVKTSSSTAISSAIQKSVNEAASNANDSMSVKRIQTSSRDMLLLMRKFNINPLFTNPTKIFSNPAKKEQEAPKPFKDEFPVASPI